MMAPRLLVTGFGPFPGAPENPTTALVRALAGEPAEAFGAGACKAVVLKTEYRRSWATLRRLYSSFAPDVVVHFGLSAATDMIRIERLARNAANPEKPDAVGYAPVSGVVARRGAETLASNLPAETIAAALMDCGVAAALSDDAGDYVCNATLYRSLSVAPATRLVGFVHVPPEGVNGLTPDRLCVGAGIVLQTAMAAWRPSTAA